MAGRITVSEPRRTARREKLRQKVSGTIVGCPDQGARRIFECRHVPLASFDIALGRCGNVVSLHAAEEMGDDGFTLLDLENIILTGTIAE